jgi:hypothetical protein
MYMYIHIYMYINLFTYKYIHICIGGKRVLVETKLTRGQQKGPHDDAMVKMLEEAKKVSIPAIYIHVYVCIYINMYVYIYIYIYIFINIYI